MKQKNRLLLFDDKTPITKQLSESHNGLVWIYRNGRLHEHKFVKETVYMIFAMQDGYVWRYDKRTTPCFFSVLEALDYVKSQCELEMDEARSDFESCVEKIQEVNNLMAGIESGLYELDDEEYPWLFRK